ncbi:MAG: nucleotidyltransferase family protein [Deltaproteobacteria bacterium]|nr:nucleotidyltransferase family protein [Deltaproteobacteria bacterium]
MAPLLGARLAELGVEDECARRWNRQRMVIWAENARRLKVAAEVIGALSARSIATLALKGVALAAAHYPHPGLRSMNDIDILVKTQARARAFAVLEELGFGPSGPVLGASIDVLHALAFARRGVEIDLHWRLLPECRDLESGPFWTNPDPIEIAGVRTVSLNRADMLFHVCVHGVRWDSAPLRWVADARVLAGRPGLDWNQLVRRAIDLRLELPVREALELLGRFAFVDVPHEVRRSLSAHAPSTFYKIEHQIRIRRPGLEGMVPRHMCLHMRRSEKGRVRTLIGLPGYLQRAYGYGSAPEAASGLTRKLWRRLRPRAPR